MKTEIGKVYVSKKWTVSFGDNNPLSEPPVASGNIEWNSEYPDSFYWYVAFNRVDILEDGFADSFNDAVKQIRTYFGE